MARLGSTGRMKAHNVSAREEVRQLDADRAQLALSIWLVRAGGVDELARERLHQLGVAASDPAEPDDAEGRPAQLQPQHRAGVPPRPAAIAKGFFRLAGAPGGGD